MSIPDWMIDTPSTSADDLSALVARLAQALRKAAPDNDLADKAMDYLARHGVAPSPLRDAHPAKAEVQPNPWQQAVDVELVSAHLGMAGNVSFADAAKALSELIQWNIDVATNPQTNGGLSLQPVAEVRAEPTQDHIPPSDEDAFEHYVSDCDGSGIQYDGPSYERGFRTGKTVGIDSVTTEVQAEPVAWMYSFTHSSAIGHGDHDIGPVVTKDRKAAFGVGCFDQQPLFTSPQATQQDAIDAAKWRFVQASPDHAVCAMDHGHGWYAVTDAAIQAAQQGGSDA